MTATDPRDDDILVAPGSFAQMDSMGETLAYRWETAIELLSEETGLPDDLVKRVLMLNGTTPSLTMLADLEMFDAACEGALLGLRYAAVRPIQVDRGDYAAVLDAVATPDWEPFWQATQALCIIHGISEEAATTVLDQFACSLDAELMTRPAFLASVVVTASLLIQHSETLH